MDGGLHIGVKKWNAHFGLGMSHCFKWRSFKVWKCVHKLCQHGKGDGLTDQGLVFSYEGIAMICCSEKIRVIFVIYWSIYVSPLSIWLKQQNPQLKQLKN